MFIAFKGIKQVILLSYAQKFIHSPKLHELNPHLSGFLCNMAKMGISEKTPDNCHLTAKYLQFVPISVVTIIKIQGDLLPLGVAETFQCEFCPELNERGMQGCH